MNSFAYIVETASDKKNQKIPDQTCANGLDLDDMPKDLHDISPLERIISLHIPFITLIVMHQYGGHYKMNGPPVNVPTTLDHVIKILLHLPQQLQVKQLKLKQKLEYKSHYMDDMIQKDKIIGALTWLKQNIDSNDSLVVGNDDVEGFEELKGVEEDTELIEDQAALD